MNFHFVDQILELVPGEKAIGIKYVTANDAYLTEDNSGRPVLLSCIVGEALGQLCSWNVIKATNCQVRSVGGIVTEVTMLGQAYLGDVIVLEIFIDSLDDQAVTWHGKASVNGQTILIIDSSIGPCLPMQDFNDIAEVKRHLAMIDRPGPLPEINESQAIIPDHLNYNPGLTSFDNILSWEKGQSVVAQKNVSLLGPYFADHFPHKPVFPISLLLQCKLQLGFSFIADMIGHDQQRLYYPARVYNIKMNDFVVPGDSLVTKLTLKSHDNNHFILHFRSEIHNRRICVAEAEFIKA